ncbi:CDP-diacylglycerol--glycerol-3-phosphate 3-phosphatidyltransferase [Candidatus Endolissoclinum faulkneri L2]|uniref:CDP-diacylglycerol--glycerol-3-phosphate 3-phosphatidyltransferase n=1 Tax=Candidatus Endolissoclinum faulkneri L2 TaxID=1193729 RepID=K7ZD32_9PROT|nr:CDP-diacylglycerol--glycerol-3-phosphate 3-phosphatidyltransferase [Candidatus Endolissoclinum faulkneri]AFX99136.1 CDP-diacylglycerol--glycerol-3-phosphate 3-phosphatidyltransferase [Candidatus Endolissoclinum faulkneri L2]
MLDQLPNWLTIFRILAVVPIALCLWLGGETLRWIALVSYILASITDYFDGYLARVMQVQSSLGRLLDPIADKLLVVASLLILVALDHISGITVLAALVIMLREILVSGLREFLAELRVSIPISRLAKWKTTVHLIAIGFLIIGDDSAKWIYFTTIGEVGLWLGVILTLCTFQDYLVKGIRRVSAHKLTRFSERNMK